MEKKRAELLIDPVVRKYWKQERDGPAHKTVYSPETRMEMYEEYKRNKRGLMGGADTAIFASIRQIAIGLVDIGLKNAAIAKKFAEAALEVGDLRQYMNPPYPKEWALYQIYNYLHQANWIMTGKKDENLKKSLEYLTIVRDRYEPPRQKMSSKDLWDETWGYVIPYLIGGDIVQARYQFQKMHGNLKVDLTKIAANGKDFYKTLYVLLDYLNKKDDKLKEIAARTMETFYYNITGWGHVGTKPRDRLWNDIVLTPGHLEISRIRADHFIGEKDPVKIIQSIKGFQDI